MGMFDYVVFEMKCPTCGTHLNRFQSKDGPCNLETLHFTEVDHFYEGCQQCGTWIDFIRREGIKETYLNLRTSKLLLQEVMQEEQIKENPGILNKGLRDRIEQFLLEWGNNGEEIDLFDMVLRPSSIPPKSEQD